jgi:HEAT repeat protein
MMRRDALNFCLLAIALAAAPGCRSVWTPDMWPFPERKQSTYHTPAMRVEAIEQFAMRSTGIDTPEQRQITDQLARQIQVEPDPLVRKAVVRTIAEFRTPLAQQVLEAGLADENEAVRIACCQALGRRGETSSVPVLANVLQNEKEIDVRLAAAEALGQIRSPEAIQALVVALDDRDPALQFVGVQSMKSITGKDYGPDVQAWRTAATSTSPPSPRGPSLAERIRSAAPF